jgi:hypothetical protein
LINRAKVGKTCGRSSKGGRSISFLFRTRKKQRKRAISHQQNEKKKKIGTYKCVDLQRVDNVHVATLNTESFEEIASIAKSDFSASGC